MIYQAGDKSTTRDGRKARIYCTDAGGVKPVHGAVLETSQCGCHHWWEPWSWTMDGELWGNHEKNSKDLMGVIT